MAIPIEKNEPEVQRTKRISRQFLCYKKRHVTDVNGLILMIITLLIVWAMQLVTYAHTYWDHEPNRTIIYNTSLLNDVHVQLLKAEDVISGLVKSPFKELIEIVILLYMAMQMVVLLHNSASKSEAEFFHDFASCQIVLIISSIIFHIGMFVFHGFKVINSAYQYFTYYWLFTQPRVFAVISFRSTPNQMCTEMQPAVKINAIRFYFLCRYLILFQCLTLTAITFLTKYVILNWIYSDHSFTDMFITFASISTVSFLHIYGKIVVMTATAFHDWDKYENGVSFKALCLAIAIVTKYHVGTIFLDIFYTPVNIIVSNFIAFLNKIFTINSRIYAIYSIPHAVQLTRMFTALLGQNRKENVNSVESLRKNGGLPAFSKSKLSEAWFLLFKYSLALLVVQMTVIYVYLFIIGAVYYIITTVDTMKNTIEFCRIEEEKLIDEDELTIIITVNEEEAID